MTSLGHFQWWRFQPGVLLVGMMGAMLSGILGLMGCSQASSSNVSAAEFYGTLSVIGNSADTITCEASWQVSGGTGTYIELSGTDTTTCSDGTNEITLSKEESLLGTVKYTGSGLTYEVGRTYTITLTKDGQTYRSTGTLPVAVNITSPAESAQITKGTALTINWTADTSNGMRVKINWESGGSSSTSSDTDNDDGSYISEASFTQTQNASGVSVTGNAPATLTLTRYLNGTFASGLKGGQIETSQQATRSIILID